MPMSCAGAGPGAAWSSRWNRPGRVTGPGAVQIARMTPMASSSASTESPRGVPGTAHSGDRVEEVPGAQAQLDPAVGTAGPGWRRTGPAPPAAAAAGRRHRGTAGSFRSRPPGGTAGSRCRAGRGCTGGPGCRSDPARSARPAGRAGPRWRPATPDWAGRRRTSARGRGPASGSPSVCRWRRRPSGHRPTVSEVGPTRSRSNPAQTSPANPVDRVVAQCLSASPPEVPISR